MDDVSHARRLRRAERLRSSHVILSMTAAAGLAVLIVATVLLALGVR